MKAAHEARGVIDVNPSDVRRAQMLLQHYEIRVAGDMQVGPIHAHNVTIKSRGRSRPLIIPSADTVGGSPRHRRYLRHLIERYHGLATKQQDRKFGYGAVYKAIERREADATWERIRKQADIFASIYDPEVFVRHPGGVLA